jgi:hypothetical protein
MFWYNCIHILELGGLMGILGKVNGMRIKVVGGRATREHFGVVPNVPIGN